MQLLNFAFMQTMVNTRRHKPPTKTNRELEAEQAVLDKCCSEIDEAVKSNGEIESRTV